MSVNKKLPITVAVVAYNDDKLLKRALESCADLVDEIVVVHDGPCSDKTLQVARKFTSKVFVRERVGSPEPHRPFSFEQAKNEWILQLDVDEYLQSDFRNALPELIKKDVSGYRVKWIEEYKNKLIFNMVKEVLFQKSRVYLIGSPCEYIKPLNAKDDLIFTPVGLVNSPLTQNSNFNSWSKYRAKYSSFATIQAKIYKKPFKNVSKWNYSGLDWDKNTKIKISHPLILGIGGMNVKYIVAIVKSALGISKDVSINAALHLMWYNTFLYWQVFKIGFAGAK